MVVAAALEGKHVQWVAPSFPIGELGWNIIDRLCRQIPGTRFEGRPVFRITLPTGGTIQLRSADNPDSLRGATLDGVVFDEAAQAKPEAWSVLRPTLSVRRGWAMFISTPKGLNWFHDLYQDAEKRNGWERWRFPSTSSPYIPPEDVELARQEMSSLVFSQEYEAEFISTGTGIFRADWIQHYYTRYEGEHRFYFLGDEPIADSACWKFHTVDLAWSLDERADYTVISSWAVTPKAHLILLDVDRGHYEGPDIVGRLRTAYTRFGGYLVVERATRQMSIIQEAQRTGLPIREVRAEKDKVARALPATARMEQGAVWFPPASTPWFRDVEEELLAFPAGRHDDFVDTLAYAVLQVAHRSPYEDRPLEVL
jgi:predicted phage terminase large subunit-like protein